MKKIKLSVVIPVWNQEELVWRSLDSIPKSKHVEVIICDDGSTDNTLKTIRNFEKEYGTEFGAFKILINKQNKGVAHTINKCYDNASGEYVVALGSDDYFYTEMVNVMLEELDGTDMIYFDLRTNDGTIFKLNEITKAGYVGSVKFIRREFLGNTRCPDKRAGEDYDFTLQLYAKNPTERFTGEVVKHYNYPRENSLFDQLKKGEIKIHE